MSQAVAAQLQITDSTHPVRIVCVSSDSTGRMARYLQGFLKARKFAVDSRIYSNFGKDYSGPQWILTDAKSARLVGVQAADVSFADRTRDEAYRILARRTNNRTALLLIGKTEAGVRSAVARLTCKVANDGKSLWIEEGTEAGDPFIRRRLIDIGDPARRQMPSHSPFKDADIETWSLPRLRAYPELFWQFGYNGVEIEEVRGYAEISDEKLPAIRKAAQTLAQGAKDHEMYVSLFQWGDCLFKEGVTFSWNNAQDRKVMRLFMKDLAEDYGPYVDHVNIHIGDPGGCNRDGCDAYQTPQQVTDGFYEAFRKINPKVECSLSTWANGAFWSSCPRPVDMSNYNPPFRDMAAIKEFGKPISDGGQFLDTTFMPKQIGINLNRVYSADQADLVTAAGRPVDVWSWYVGDNEMINTIWLNMRDIDSIFRALPEKAHSQIRNYSMELTFHGWPQIINSYVAARKMWDTKAPLEEIELEFCSAAFGPSNAKAMRDAFDACENGEFNTIPKPRNFGTRDYNARLRSILNETAAVRLAPDWKSNFALPVPAQKLVDMLKARLQLIVAVSEAKEKIVAAKKSGADAQAIAEIKKKAIADLPVLPIDPIYKQDNSIVGTDDAIPTGFATATFAQMIEAL